MPSRKDPVREISHVVVYAVFYIAPLFLGFGFLMQALVGNFAGMTLANLAAALFANWLALEDLQGNGRGGDRALVEPRLGG